uniref:Uncharacterized protein n=1 Tax=Pithovirus LCPAC201 TaxID=2506591 RepID=A0A481Z7N8_9VIRU|nr:MAG: hypothetical protein LCPAC201_00120 [Pithovirus LCPAC201]
MALQSLWNLTTNNGGVSFSQQIFTLIFLAIVIGWILVALWSRTLDNFTYGLLGLNPDSTWDAVIIALAITIIFIALIWVVDQYDLVPGGLGQDVESEEAIAGVGTPLTTPGNNNQLNQQFGDARQASTAVLFPGLVFR